VDIPADAVHETKDDIFAKAVKLAGIIEADCQKSGEAFDMMVILPRGAFYPANIVSRKLGFTSMDILSASISAYKEGRSDRQDFKLGQMPTEEEVSGKNLLIIDEVCDTGFTLQYLTNYLKNYGAKQVKSGVIHYKPGRSETHYEPDWYVEKTDKWIVYPWEENEIGSKPSAAKRKN